MAYGGDYDSDDYRYDQDFYGEGSYGYDEEDYEQSDPPSDNDDDYQEEDDDDLDVDRRSKYAPEISPAAIRAIILKELAMHGVNTEFDIPDERYFRSPENHEGSLRYFESKGFAWFTCKKQHKPNNKIRRWPSAHSWCFIDLKKQEICYRYEQECNTHNIVAQPGPEFTEEAIQKMAKWVVKGFLIKTLRIQHVPRVSTDTDQTEGGPHDEGRCGKCKQLGRSCWKK